MDEPKKEYKEIPVFASEEEEIAFWDAANIEDYFDLDHPTGIRLRATNKPRRRRLTVALDERLQREIRAVVGEYDEPFHPFMREILYRGIRGLREARAPGAGRR